MGRDQLSAARANEARDAIRKKTQLMPDEDSSSSEDSTAAPELGAFPPPRQERLYKVPVDQRRANPDAYTPYLFSFGPYHRDAFLDDGDHLKQKTAEALQTSDELEGLIKKIEEHEIQIILAQYVQWHHEEWSGHIDLAARMLALDAITIIAATINPHLQKITLLVHPLARLVLSDAILLENQVPVCVLECALKSLAENWKRPVLEQSGIQWRLSQQDLPSLEEVICWYCKRTSPFPEWKLEQMPPLDDTAKGESLLAFLYQFLFERLTLVQPPLVESQDPSFDKPSGLPTASRLSRCGVRFRPCDTHLHLDIKNGVLFLPKINVNDMTVRVLHNLLAYEATVPGTLSSMPSSLMCSSWTSSSTPQATYRYSRMLALFGIILAATKSLLPVEQALCICLLPQHRLRQAGNDTVGDALFEEMA